MEEDQLVKRIIGSDESDMKLRERLQMGWMNSVKRALNKRGMSEEQ